MVANLDCYQKTKKSASVKFSVVGGNDMHRIRATYVTHSTSQF